MDLESRFGAQLNLNLPRKFEASVGYEGRMIGNSSVYRGSYLSGEISRPVGKLVVPFITYRFARVIDPDSHLVRVSHRYGIGAEAETKRGKVTLSFRALFHYQPSVLDDAEQTARRVLRTRVRAKLPATKQLTVYGSVEPYFAFTDVYPVDNWRNTVGAEWKFLNDFEIDLHYIYRPDYAKFYNRTYHIIGAELSTELKLPF